ncbi:MAG TPA: hypothetical protein VHW03_03095, partial [Chthoniobacterales bacterium]|nr:hypothetical protein [Chthoniobacterales bacterium]
QSVRVLPIVCRFSGLPPNDEGTALQLEFLPDALVLEAEWQQERALTRSLEAEHAASLQRVPGALFLEQARFALMLRKMLAREKISHLHATSSRALVGALLVKELLPISVSVAVERNPTLPRTALKEALLRVNGGRVFDPRLVRQNAGSFLLESAPGLRARLKLDGRDKFWREWSDRLKQLISQ